MKYIPASVFAVIMLAGCIPPKNPTAKEVLINIAKHYNSHKSISYQVHYNVKAFNKEEPYKYYATCVLIRDTHDSIFNGLIHATYYSYGGFERYYDLDKIYFINDSSKKGTRYDDPKRES